MTSSPSPEALLDAISALAMEIAQQCPEAAERAGRIATLAGEIRAAAPVDRGRIQDALEAQLEDGDMSDTQVRTTTEAVFRAVRREG